MSGSWKRLLFLLSCVCVADAALSENTNPHAPQQFTWQIIDPGMGTVVNSTQQIAPPGTWWPTLHLCF